MDSASDSEEEPAETFNSDSDSDTEITALRNIQRLNSRQAMNREEVEVSVPGPSSSHPNPNRESSRSKRRRLDMEQKESRKQRLVDAMKLYESQRTDLKNKHKKSELSAYEKLKEAISNDYPGTSTPTIRILFVCWIRIRIR